ncbi:MAG: FixH family protein [Rhodoglobus sp.]
MLLFLVGMVVVISLALVARSMLVTPSVTGSDVSTQAGPFTVTLTVDNPTAGTRDAQVRLTDATDTPVSEATVTFSATMASMGHAGQVVRAQPIAAGRYRLDGDLFPMVGQWTIRIGIQRSDQTTVATLPLTITAA